MRTLLAIGKNDAYYSDRKELIGLRAEVESIHSHRGGGFISCVAIFDPCPNKYISPKYYFCMAKWSKE